MMAYVSLRLFCGVTSIAHRPKSFLLCHCPHYLSEECEQSIFKLTFKKLCELLEFSLTVSKEIAKSSFVLVTILSQKSDNLCSCSIASFSAHINFLR